MSWPIPTGFLHTVYPRAAPNGCLDCLHFQPAVYEAYQVDSGGAVIGGYCHRLKKTGNCVHCGCQHWTAESAHDKAARLAAELAR